MNGGLTQLLIINSILFLYTKNEYIFSSENNTILSTWVVCCMFALMKEMFNWGFAGFYRVSALLNPLTVTVTR